MRIQPEIDLTPETAAALSRFRAFFWTERFALLLFWGKVFGQTDLGVLRSLMDAVCLCAAGSSLCPPPEEVPQSGSDITDLADTLQEQVLAWYSNQTPEVQKAVLELLRALQAWVVSLTGTLSPEAQEVLDSLRELLQTLQEQAVFRTYFRP